MLHSIVLADNLPVKRYSKMNYFSERCNGIGNQEYLQQFNPEQCSDNHIKNSKLNNYVNYKNAQQENKLIQNELQTINEGMEAQQNLLKQKQINAGSSSETNPNQSSRNEQFQQKIAILRDQVSSLKEENKKLIVMNKTIQSKLFQKLFDSRHQGSVNNNSLIIDVFSHLISSHLTSESNPLNELTRQLLKQKQTTEQLKSTIQQNQSDITILNQILKQLASKLQQLTNQVQFHQKESQRKSIAVGRAKHLQNTNRYLISESSKLKHQISQLRNQNNDLTRLNSQFYSQISIWSQNSNFSFQIFQLAKQLIQKDIKISNLSIQLQNRKALNQDTDRLIESNYKNELIIEGLTNELLQVRLKTLNQKYRK